MSAQHPAPPRRRLRVLTWHVHGNYLYYLSHAPHDFYLATLPGHPPGHAGRTGSLPWGDNVHEVDAEALPGLRFDCVLYQHRRHWDEDRLTRLSPALRALPTIYLEHDPPQEHPTDTRHPAAEAGVHLVHVTPFNALMWNNDGAASTTVVEHGVVLPAGVRYVGDRESGLVVVNHLARRGRRLGADVYEQVGRQVPLVLVGMDSERSGGRGEVPNLELAATMARHRFFFNPIRWTSLGLAVVEAMMVGLPIVALATTEMPSVIANGYNGFTDTRIDRLVQAMRQLIAEPDLAAQWGRAARRTALDRFSIERFITDWDRLLQQVTGH